MNRLLFLFIALLSVLTVGCRNAEPKSQTDETYSLEDISPVILQLGADEPTKALAQIDSLEWQGRLRHTDAQLLRAKVDILTLENEKMNVAIVICEQLMTNDTVTASAELTENVLETMLDACRLSNDYEGALAGATQLVNLCNEQGWHCEALRNEAEVGALMASLGMVDEGLAKIDSVIHCLDGIRQFNELDAYIIALRRKIGVLDNATVKTSHVDNPMTSIIEASELILDRLADYEQHPDDYHDGTYREPVGEENRSNYIDFYRAKAYLYIANSYAQAGDRTQARNYLHLYEESSFSMTLSGRRSSASVYALLGEHDRALRIYDEWVQDLGDDTLNDIYATILMAHANKAEAQGHYAEAYHYLKRFEKINNILVNRLLRSKAHLYATRFNVQKQQQDLERQRHKLQLNRIINFFTVLITLILTVVLLYRRHKWKEEVRRNHIIVEEINETMKYKQLYESQQQEKEKKQENQDNQEKPEKQDNPRPVPEEISSSEIFQDIRNVIVKEQLFLQSDIDRQILIDRTGYNKNLIATAFKDQNLNLSGFIRNLRLEHAVKLFNEQPELTVKQVCFSSAFNRYDVFARAFKTRYGITPTEFHEEIHSHLMP